MESEKTFRAIFNSAADGIIVADVESKEFYMGNRVMCQMLDCSTEEITNLGVADIHPEGDLPYVKEQFEKQARGELTLAKDIPVKRKDGSVFYADVNSIPITLGSKKCLMGIFRDVTERKQAEQEREEILHDMEERIKELNCIYRVSESIRTRETLEEVFHHIVAVIPLGLQYPEIARGKIYFDGVEYVPVPFGQTEWRRTSDIIINGVRRGSVEVYYLEERAAKDEGPFLKEECNLIDGICRTLSESIERKEAEGALRESEARYRTLVEQLPAVTYMAALDEAGTTVYISPQVEDFMGFTPEEYKADPDIWRKQLHPDDRDRVLKKLSESHTTKKPFVDEYRMITKNGSIVWFRDEAVVVKDEMGRPLFLQGVMYNITERKEAEYALRQSEIKHRTLLENLPQSIFLKDRNSIYASCNENFAGDLNIEPDEIVGKTDYHFFPKELAEKYRADDKRIMESGQTTDIEEKAILQGREMIVHTVKTPVRDEQGNIVGVLGIFWDITERRRTEQALHESEEKYRTLVESAGDPIAAIDKDGVFLFMNTTAAQHLGGKSEELIGKTMWDLFPKEMADQHAAVVREVINAKQGKNLIVQTEIQGQPRWYNMNLEPLRDGSGKAIAALMIARDIHDIKQAEEQIRKLSSAVEQSIDGIAIGDLEPRLLYVNDAYARMHGYTPEDMVGMKVVDLHNEEQMDAVRKAIRQIKTQGSWTGEVGHIKKDGTVFPTQMSVTLLKSDKGEATGILAVCRDITEYKQTQEILRIRDAAIESSMNGIAMTDLKGNLTYINNSFLKMWGYEAEDEVLGRNAIEFWQTPDEASRVMEMVQEKGGWSGELTAVKKDGSAFDAQVFATMVTDNDGRPTCTMSSFVDVTESKQKEEELSIYREKMARAEQLASLGTLSATVAHELTQPLTVIRLSIENALAKLQSTSSAQTIAKKLEDCLNQVANITSIAERFRNFARKSSTKIVREVDLKVVAGRIVNLLNENARRARMTLRLGGMSKLPPIYSNERDLEQLFFALIDNAIQAADGKKARQLTISGSVKGEHVELRFSDNCGGIAPENLEKVFEPFFTTRHPSQGTGLGLCIVEDIVSRAGGRIRVESKFGKGSTFFVTLPITEGATS